MNWRSLYGKGNVDAEVRRENTLIRVISARDTSAKERVVHEQSRPPFANEAEERAHWERTDAGADLDWSRAERVRLPNLQPSTT